MSFRAMLAKNRNWELQNRSMECVREAGKEIEELYKSIPPLTSHQTDYLHEIYGVHDDGSNLDIVRPPSPSESATSATEYLQKMSSKGLFSNSKNWQAASLFQASPKAKKAVQTDIVSLESIFEAEPFQKFWLTSDIAKETISEIKRLPFINPKACASYISKFFASMASIVRSMGNERVVEDSHKTTKELQKAMRLFLIESHNSRKALIEMAIKSGCIDTSKLSEEYKSEFSSLISISKTDDNLPQQEPPKISSIEQAIIERVAQGSEYIPSQYRYKPRRETDPHEKREEIKQIPIIVNEEFEKVTKKPQDLQSRMSTPGPVCRRRPVIISVHLQKERHTMPPFKLNKPMKIASLDEIHSNFWKLEDPLIQMRPGEQKDILDDLTKTVNGFSFEKPQEAKVDMPLLVQDPPQKTKSLGKLEPLEIPQSKRIYTQEEIQNAVEMSKKEQLPPLSDSSDAMRYLLAHDMSTRGSEGLIHKKLQEVWTSLGFSVQQKFSLVLKYSESPEEGQRLSDALKYWESALESSKNYETTYQAAKNYLKYEADGSDLSIGTAQKYISDVKEWEDSLIKIAGNLMGSFNDELVMKKMRAIDLITRRREKMSMLLAKVEERAKNKSVGIF